MPRARRGMASEMDSDGGRCNIPLALIGRTMRQLALTTTQQRRLERLAREARRTPKAMLQFVLRDGFEACEEDVRESLAADAEFASGKSVTHKEAALSDDPFTAEALLARVERPVSLIHLTPRSGLQTQHPAYVDTRFRIA